MVAFNFKNEFVPLILTGTKVSTVRKTARCKPGDKMQLYTGQRTKDCKLIGEATCYSVLPFEVGPGKMAIANTLLHPGDWQGVALQEGFMHHSELFAFFADHYGLPFSGFMHRWGDLET